MLVKQNRHSMNAGSVIVLTLLNIVIIRNAYIGNHQFLFLLTVTLPLLGLALYYVIAGPRFHNVNYRLKSPGSRRHRILAAFRPGGAALKELEMTVGNSQCASPYRSSIFTLASKEIRPLAAGSDIITRYRLADGGWLCRVDAGISNANQFDAGQFIEMASAPAVKMVELRLSGLRNSIQDNGSPLFPDAEGMIHFLGNLRDYCGGKPVGIRLAIGEKKPFHEICYAIRKTQITPDFMVIEGPEDGREAAALQVNGGKLMPVYDALFFAARTLQLYGLEKDIRLIAAANIHSGFDILKIIALGANGVCADVSGRSTKPDGPRGRVENGDSAMNDAANRRRRILHTAAGLMEKFGFKSMGDITLPDFFRRMALG